MAHRAQQNVSVMFLPQFDALCDPLHYTQIAKWNLFVSNDKKLQNFPKQVSIEVLTVVAGNTLKTCSRT